MDHSRLAIALHIPQDLLPLSGVGSQSNGSKLPSSKAVGSGSGYGPPIAPEGTPLSRLVSSTLYTSATDPTPSEASIAGYVGAGGRTEYDLVCLPLTNPSWQERWERMCTISTSGTMMDLNASSNTNGQGEGSEEWTRREAETWRAGGGFARGEVNVTRSEEAGSLLAIASDWLELDSQAEGIRFDSELALRQEVAYASYLSLTTIILPPPRLENSQYITDYARAVNGALASSWHINISIRIPVNFSTTPTSSSSTVAVEDDPSTWEAWNTIRSICGYSPRLTCTLDLTNPLPPLASLGRWSAEPIKHIFLPCTTFIPNAKGYPVLSKSLQAFFKGIFKFDPTVILSGASRSHHSSGGPLAYAQYIRYLHRKAGPLAPVEQYAQGYMDNLQTPLQPLMDNLEGETYEGFEKDPIKYRQYEEAVFQALRDRPAGGVVTIFVVGAGRGPLVAGCLRAAERSGRTIKITAVEKNPNAFVVLQEREALEWGDAVQLVYSDMRSFNPRLKADIIVSELLGSFGDNELSPECLDGVMRCLKPDGISIPASYTSYLAPITSSKLHAEVTGAGAVKSSHLAEARPAERPYVVMFSAFHVLSAQGGRLNSEKIQECWGFDHPRPDVVVDENGLPFTNQHNARSAHLTFHIPQAGVCHGFAGYFEAVLYGDVGLSLHPERSVGDMLSWFPIFFPLQDPLYLPAHSEMDIQLWRLTDGLKRKVWFEWCATTYLSASSILYSTTPGSTAGSASTNDRLRHFSASHAGNLSPMVDAFASAPSPRLLLGNDRDSGRMQAMQDDSMSISLNDLNSTRIKIGFSKLHNPGGKVSSVGL